MTLTVLDFRRRRSCVNWHAENGTWSPSEETDPHVHGVALIQPQSPHLCLFAAAGALILQAGVERFTLQAEGPQLDCGVAWERGGLGRRLRVRGTTGATLFEYAYWFGADSGFCALLAARAADPAWRTASARDWSAGLPSTRLRADWAR